MKSLREKIQQLIKITPRENAGKINTDFVIPIPDDPGFQRKTKPRWGQQGGIKRWIKTAKAFDDMQEEKSKVLNRTEDEIKEGIKNIKDKEDEKKKERENKMKVLRSIAQKAGVNVAIANVPQKDPNAPPVPSVFIQSGSQQPIGPNAEGKMIRDGLTASGIPTDIKNILNVSNRIKQIQKSGMGSSSQQQPSFNDLVNMAIQDVFYPPPPYQAPPSPPPEKPIEKEKRESQLLADDLERYEERVGKEGPLKYAEIPGDKGVKKVKGYLGRSGYRGTFANVRKLVNYVLSNKDFSSEGHVNKMGKREPWYEDTDYLEKLIDKKTAKAIGLKLDRKK